MGWWSGERLCDQYAVLAERLENRLAVADATGRRLSHGELWRESERFSLGSHAPIFLASPLGHSIGAIHGARLSRTANATTALDELSDGRRDGVKVTEQPG